MRGLAINPGVPQSLAVADLDEPPRSDGPVLVDGVRIGICGTDREIAAGVYGEAPPGESALVLGHESLGRVVEDDSGTFHPGDLVVGVVRRPDPVPCPNCAAGEWDMCANGQYTEHGIKALRGFGSQRYRLDPRYTVGVPDSLGEFGVLVEPASVVAKAWEHALRIGERGIFRPRTALVTGAGPIGLLAAMLGRQRGLDVYVLDRVTRGPKPELVEDLGAEYFGHGLDRVPIRPDVVMECTGSGALILDVLRIAAPNGVVCLTGVSPPGNAFVVDVGKLDRELVLENIAVFGSVNANLRHYRQAVDALCAADPAWLARLITRKVPLEKFAEAFTALDDDVKVTIELGA